ncbi:phosphatidylglycerophosphatase A family protein [Acetohalobium arabaticum]|uniref:Phosphatidylglycerophosphatase A n=1 Tax=Acetohalobium arabaticum (strain ATCC 49924 / DSM 5501 / Z-7288) TaxID=574087 RepID=D9QR87_ACEAZ|nr:phosphatidylglycerophosphatase A [Acetohalobium arabaticum]ADL13028.1 phosphatidylglycerophosphatase A [Acetohalobium arabaticum DSM 5501]
MLKKRIIKLLATGFYSGLSPIAPGTVGTIAALVFAFIWLQKYTINFAFILFFVIAGTLISQWAEELYGVKDAAQIVIDEWAGFFIAVFGLGVDNFIPAFILFRIFDILKPPPIKNLQQFHGGIGIMLDDILAGLMANVLLRLVLNFL